MFLRNMVLTITVCMVLNLDSFRLSYRYSLPQHSCYSETSQTIQKTQSLTSTIDRQTKYHCVIDNSLSMVESDAYSRLLSKDSKCRSTASTSIADYKYVNMLDIMSFLQLAKLLPTTTTRTSSCVDNVISQAYRNKDIMRRALYSSSQSGVVSSLSLASTSSAPTENDDYQAFIFSLYQIYTLKRIELNQSLQRMLSSPLSAIATTTSPSSPSSSLSTQSAANAASITNSNKNNKLSIIRATSSSTAIDDSDPAAADLNRDHIFNLISQFEIYNFNIEPDTVHILISDAFKKGQVEFAEYLFHHFFIIRRIPPNHRSLNIMIENFRLLDNSVLAFKYFDYFKTQPAFAHLQPDTYTLSSLIRMARSPSDIMNTLTTSSSGSSSNSNNASSTDSQQPPAVLLTAPVVRCAVETLGRLGEQPELVVRVAQQWLSDSDSVYVSHRSGDALITALIQSMQVQQSSSSNRQYTTSNNKNGKTDDSASRRSSCTHTSGLDMALQLCLPDLFNSSNKAQPSSSAAATTTVVVYSGKGLTALFTGIQRELRYLCSQRYSLAAVIKQQQRSMNDEDVESSKEKQAFVMVTQRIAHLRKASETLEYNLLLTLSTASTSTTPTASARDEVDSNNSNDINNRNINNNSDNAPMTHIELNGRLCDAILRTYLEDAEGARDAWLKRLLPAVKRRQQMAAAALAAASTKIYQSAVNKDNLVLASSQKQQQSPQSNSLIILTEAGEKSLEALMFISGFNNKAEMGLEAARTARSRGFPKYILTKLGQAYSRGKMEKMSILTRSRKSVSGGDGSATTASTNRLNWVEQGLERSIESELGVLLDTNSNKQFPIQNIRFKF